jgi:hypothetical protein
MGMTSGLPVEIETRGAQSRDQQADEAPSDPDALFPARCPAGGRNSTGTDVSGGLNRVPVGLFFLLQLFQGF